MFAKPKSFSTPLLLVLILATYNFLQAFWICDDGFISFRFSRNLALGHGLRFNLLSNPPIEGYTNLLWVLAGAPFEFFNIPGYQVLPYISILTGLLLIWRVYLVMQYALGYSARAALLPAFLLSCFPPFIIWATSGLETMPFALFIWLVFEQLLLRTDATLLYTCLAGAALALTRAEGALWALTFATLAVIFRPEQRALALKFIGFILLLLIVHGGWRYSYYQEFLPNTAAAKVSFSLERLQRGMNYCIVYCLTFLVPLLAIAAIFARRTLAVFLIWLVFGGFFAYSALSGGDYMSMGRFLVPAAAFQSILLSVLFLKITQGARTETQLIATLCCIIAYLPMLQINLVPKSIRSAFHFRLNSSAFIDEYEHWQFMQANSRRWRLKGELLAKISQPGDSLIDGAIGNVGYFSNLEIYDRLGLVTKLGSAFAKKKMSSPGHDVKAPLAYFLKDNPTFLYANILRKKELATITSMQQYYPYAPEITEVDLPQAKQQHYFVYLKKAANEVEYAEKWRIYWERRPPGGPDSLR